MKAFIRRHSPAISVYNMQIGDVGRIIGKEHTIERVADNTYLVVGGGLRGCLYNACVNDRVVLENVR